MIRVASLLHITVAPLNVQVVFWRKVRPSLQLLVKVLPLIGQVSVTSSAFCKVPTLSWYMKYRVVKGFSAIICYKTAGNTYPSGRMSRS